jgi:hypothetical protein
MGSEFTPDARQEQHEAPWHQCAPSLRDLVSRYRDSCKACQTQKFETAAVVKKGGGGRGERLVNLGSKQAGKRVRGSWNVKFKFVTPHFIFACLIASAQNRRLRIVVETEVNFRRDAETRVNTIGVTKPE